MQKKYTKDLYDKLSPDKKENILDAAVKEFALAGINGCNVRDIAKRAGISHGSLFHYFSSKNDMIHTIIQYGVFKQQEVFKKGMSRDKDFFQQMESIFTDAIGFAKNNKDIISIWLELSQPYHEEFTHHTLEMEKTTIQYLKAMVKDGIRNGSIRKDLSCDFITYMIDSILANIIKSDVSDIERKKFNEHFRIKSRNPETIAKGLISFLKETISSGSL